MHIALLYKNLFTKFASCAYYGFEAISKLVFLYIFFKVNYLCLQVHNSSPIVGVAT